GARVAIGTRRAVLHGRIHALPVPAHLRRALVVVGRTVGVAVAGAVDGWEGALPVRTVVLSARDPVVAQHPRAGHAPACLARVERAGGGIQVAWRARRLLRVHARARPGARP